MTSNAPQGSLHSGSMQAHTPPVQEKNTDELKHLEHATTSPGNLVYDDEEEEPELHARTYFALLAMFFLNLVQVFALQGPPAVVSHCLPSHEILSVLVGLIWLTVGACSFPILEMILKILRAKPGSLMPCHWSRRSLLPLSRLLRMSSRHGRCSWLALALSPLSVLQSHRDPAIFTA